MGLRRLLGAAVLVTLIGCQAPAPATPTSAPAPIAVAKPGGAAPPAASATRVEVLNSASTAYRAGDFKAAATLYDRVVNTPPAANEGPAVNTVTDFAHFRAMLSLLLDSREDEAKMHLDLLQQRDPASPLARLGTQLWDQYGMTGQVRGACAQLQSQVTSQASATLSQLQNLGVAVDAQTLCNAPQG